MKRRVTTKEIADALGISRQAVNKRRGKEGWPCVKEARQVLFPTDKLPAEVQIAIRERAQQERGTVTSCSNDAKRIAVWKEFESAEGYRRKIAGDRMDAMMALESLLREGLSLGKAREAVAERLASSGIKPATVSALKRWGRMVKGKPRCDWMAYLLPEAKAARAKAPIHPSAWVAFKRDYLRLEQPSIASCYRRLQRQAKANPAWGRLPSIDTFVRRIAAEVSRPQLALRREGTEAMEALGPKIMRDRSDLAVLQAVNSDGHVFDVAVTFPDRSVGRPVLVGWQDNASGKVLSWRIGKSETSDLVRLSFCDMVRDYGIPAHAYLDNGRAYASKKNTGGLPTRYRYKVKPEEPDGVINRLGTVVHWITPYNGKAKPIERAWRDFAHDIAKRPEFAGAYLGNHPGAKPENYGSRAIPFEEFKRVLEDGIAEHNAREGRRSPVCDGRSFDQAFNEGCASATIKRATQQQLTLLLLASELVKVDARLGEVRLAGNRYWSPALVAHAGQRVELRFDPEALHDGVHAIDLDGSYIAKVPCIAALGWGKSEQFQEARKAQAAWRRAQKAERAAAERLEAAHEAKDAPPIESSEPPPPAATALFVAKRKPSKPTPAGDTSALITPEVSNFFRNIREGKR